MATSWKFLKLTFEHMPNISILRLTDSLRKGGSPKSTAKSLLAWCRKHSASLDGTDGETAAIGIDGDEREATLALEDLMRSHAAHELSALGWVVCPDYPNVEWCDGTAQIMLVRA